MPTVKVDGKVYESPLTKRINGKEYRLYGRNDMNIYRSRKRASEVAKALRSWVHGNDAAQVVAVDDMFVVYEHRKGGWSLF
jgi:hypothetical protein